jgi:hypothetical protein
MVKENKRVYWIKESPQEIASWLRQNLAALNGKPMRVVDFKDMYTNIPHGLLLERVKAALQEAMEWEAQKLHRSGNIGYLAFSRLEEKFCEVQAEGEASLFVLPQQAITWLQWTLENCFVTNGATVRRQTKGIPMGISPSPQLANIFCYITEKQFVYSSPAVPRSINCRYLDDLFVVDPIPSEEQYGMKYAVSSEGLDVVYVGIRIYMKDGITRTTLYDREEEYPFHIMRYPHIGSSVSDAQLGGVVMGRLMAAQQFCSTLWDFKQSVVWILRRAVEKWVHKEDGGEGMV